MSVAPSLISKIRPVQSRPRKLIVPMIDASLSMSENGKIEAANNAVRAAGIALSDLQSSNPETEIEVRRLKFASEAEWLDSDAVAITDFKHVDLKCSGGTATGDAIRLLVSYLSSISGENHRNAGSVMISDGQPNSLDDYQQAINEAMKSDAFARADRIAIAIGADADQECLKLFASPGFPVLTANNPQELVQFLKMASVILAKGDAGGEAFEDLEEVDVNPASIESIPWN